jgi:hypothetical protein
VNGNPGDFYTDTGGAAFYYKTAGIGTDTGWLIVGPLQLPIVNQDIAPFIPGQPILMVGQRAFAGGANFQVVGLVRVGAPVAGTALLVPAGPLTLTTAEWDVVTGSVGGLVPGARYFVASGPAGFITPVTLSPPDANKPIGFALNTTTMAVMCAGDRPLEVDANNVPFGTALELNFRRGFVIGSSGGGVVDVDYAALYSPPEQWGQDNVVAGQVNVALGAKVSTNFNTIEAMRPGSLIGINARLSAPIAAGTLTIQVTINGAPASLSITMTAPSQSSQAVQNIGVVGSTYVVGDLIGVRISTDAAFAPAGTNDLEVWLQLAEVI